MPITTFRSVFNKNDNSFKCGGYCEFTDKAWYNDNDFFYVDKEMPEDIAEKYGEGTHTIFWIGGDYSAVAN